MMKQRFLKIIIIFLGIFSGQNSSILGMDVFYDELKKENLKSLSETPPLIPDTERNGRASFAREELNAKIFLSEQQRRTLAFDIVSKYAQKGSHAIPKNIIDIQSWKDLEIVSGSGSHPECSLVSRLDCTSSELGKVLLYAQLLQPSDDIVTIEQKQQIIATLLENQEIFEELDKLFIEFFKDQRFENNMLSFWSGNDLFESYVQYPEFSTERFQAIAQWLQTNEINTQIQEGGDIISYSIVNRVSGLLRNGAEVALGNLRTNPLIKDFWTVFPVIKETLVSAIQSVRRENWTNAARIAVAGSITAVLSRGENNRMTPFIAPIAWYAAGKMVEMSMMIMDSLMYNNLGDGIKAVAELNSCMYKRLLLIAAYIKFMQRVGLCLDKVPRIKDLLPSLKDLTLNSNPCSLFSYFAQEFSGPATFEQFINKLHAIGDDENSWQSNYIGRVIATYRAIELNKEHLLPPMMALAQLDMFLSLVRFFKKNQENGNPMCYPSFVQDHNCKHPQLVLKDFWSPIIAHNPVPNSLTLGADGKERNALITGPNMGGKSTTMREIIFVVLLGQSVGIVPAKQACFTPFSTIRAYLNITDDAGDGISLFKASAHRASVLINDAQQESKYSLITFDELFNGTNPRGGEALAYATLKKLGSSPDFERTISIASTHYSCLQELAQDQAVKFAFYKMDDSHDKKNRFKLLPGCYTTFNGFDIAQESGLTDSILTSARQYYDQKFVKNSELEMLLKLLAYDISLLKGFIIPNEIQKFVALIFVAPYNERFFILAKEKNLNLTTLLSEVEDQGHFMLRYAAELNIADKQLLTKLISLGAQDPDERFSEYFVDNHVKCVELVDDEDSVPSDDNNPSHDDDEVEELGESFNAFSINSMRSQKSKQKKTFKLAYAIRGNRAYKDYTDDECSFGPEVPSITQVTIASGTIVVRSKDKMERQFRKSNGCFLGTLEKCEHIGSLKHQKNKQQKNLEVSSDRFLVKLKDDDLYIVAVYNKELEHLFDLESVYPSDKPTSIAIDHNTIVVGRESGIVEVHLSTDQVICPAAIA